MKKITLLLLTFFFVSSIQSQSIATYDITLTTIWNVTDHSSVPGNAHWSDLIGASHNTPNEFVELGTLASLGIQTVAETGGNGPITNEINAAIALNTAPNTPNSAKELLQKSIPFGPEETVTISDIEFDEDHHYLTLVSMVAPSPDWFIAINSLDLRNAGNTAWKTTFTIDVFAYDSGTDSGTNYGSGNQPTNPAVPVFMITGAPINGNKMGTLTLTLKNVLGVNEFNAIDSVKIYPNPSNGDVTISNTKYIETIEVYNVLGNMVKQVNIKNSNTISLDLNQLNKGIYLVRLKDVDGKSKTQKLLLQ